MKEEIVFYCDGGALGNPGPAAAAFFVVADGQIFYQFVKKLGRTTNNVAEYEAVIAALGWLKENKKVFQKEGNDMVFNFYLDSQLVVNQLNGVYKIKETKLRVLIIKAKILEKEIDEEIFYHHIPRAKNKIADSLIKRTLSAKNE